MLKFVVGERFLDATTKSSALGPLPHMVFFVALPFFTVPHFLNYISVPYP
jgi:hypothetical protein